MKKSRFILLSLLALGFAVCIQPKPGFIRPTSFEQIMALDKEYSATVETGSSEFPAFEAPPSDIDTIEVKMFQQSDDIGGVIRVKCTDVQNYTTLGKDPVMYVFGGHTVTVVEITHIYKQYNTPQLHAGDSISYQERYAIFPQTLESQLTYLRRLGLNPVLLEDGSLEPSIYAELDVRTDWRFELQEGDHLDEFEVFFYDYDILPLKVDAEYLMVVKYDPEKACFVPQYTAPCDMSLYPNLSDRNVFRMRPRTLQVMETMREKYLK